MSGAHALRSCSPGEPYFSERRSIFSFASMTNCQGVANNIAVGGNQLAVCEQIRPIAANTEFLMPTISSWQVAGLLEPRPSLFNTEDNYFEQRFFVFTLLQAPAPLTYDVYAASMNLSGELYLC